MLNSTYKRLPQNPNIKLHWGQDYNEYELMPGVGPFIEQNLAKIDRTIRWAREQSTRLYAVRLDLRFPQHYELSGLGDFSNDPINRCLKSLKGRLDRYCKSRLHWHNYASLWSREYDKGDTRPHFHVLLLLNGHAFRAIGNMSRGGESLYRMIEESWLSALGCRGPGLDKLVHVCKSGQYWINTADCTEAKSLFKRASYMAKVRDKGFDDGYLWR